MRLASTFKIYVACIVPLVKLIKIVFWVLTSAALHLVEILCILSELNASCVMTLAMYLLPCKMWNLLELFITRYFVILCQLSSVLRACSWRTCL